MNATNPVPSAAGTGDARPYEPSMEEILASIRRIIADDQSLPGRAKAEELVLEDGTSGSLHVLHSDGSSDTEPQSATPTAGEAPEHAAPQRDDGAMTAQGTIAAPQYPSPEMPSIEPASHETAIHETATHEPADHEPISPESTVFGLASHEAIPREATTFEPATREPAPALSDRLEAIHHQAHDEPAQREVATVLGGSGDYFDPPDEHDRPGVLAAEAASLFSATTNSSVASAFNVLAASRLADNSDELLGMARDMIKPLLRSWLDENLPSMVERMVRDEIERVARGGH